MLCSRPAQLRQLSISFDGWRSGWCRNRLTPRPLARLFTPVVRLPFTTCVSNIMPIQTLPELIALIGPIFLALLTAWFFVRRHRPFAGTLASLGVLFLLWLAAEYWVFGEQCQSNPTCSVDYYFIQVWNRHSDFIQIVLPIIAAVLLSQSFLQRGRIRTGILVGIGAVVLSWLVTEYATYQSCLSCNNPGLCCEWTGIGMLLYLGLAIIQAAVVTLINVGIARNYKRSLYPQGAG